MEIRFWGTRGSIPSPGLETVKYGGNTLCTELRTNSNTLIIIDCGTGLRSLGKELIKSYGKKPIKGHIILSHTHWDHIQGLPFFAPLFVPGNEWDIYAPRGFEESLRETLAGQMQYSYFPVSLDQLGSTIRYHELAEGAFLVDDVVVTAQYLNHTSLTLGYRLEGDGSTIVYACDHEPFDEALANGKEEIYGQDLHHVDFLKNADLVIHDAQYTIKEYKHKRGWGHSTVEYAVEVCRLANAKQVALTHHDPERTDDEIDDIINKVKKQLSGTNINIFAASEVQTLIF